jgi:hypothetical protein
LSAAFLDRNGDYFLLELAAVDSGDGLLVTGEGKAIHGLASDSIFFADELSGVSHDPLLERAPETIDKQGLSGLDLPALGWIHAAVYQMGGLAHVFDTTRYE